MFGKSDAAEFSNREVYGLPGIVDAYVRETELQPPEQAVLARFAANWSTVRMLDIGIGAGRTTPYFAPAVREYTGIDYSPAMIAECRRHEVAYETPVSLFQCDARNMGIFANGSFDFILFSFNGIDYVSLEGRWRIFSEILRVSAPGCRLCFSSHNLQYLPRLFSLQPPANPLFWPVELWRVAKLRRLNPGLNNGKDREYAIVNDGAHGFALQQTFYIRPETQLRQLEGLGFYELEVLGIGDGMVVERSEIDSRTDPWLYYLCRVR